MQPVDNYVPAGMIWQSHCSYEWKHYLTHWRMFLQVTLIGTYPDDTFLPLHEDNLCHTRTELFTPFQCSCILVVYYACCVCWDIQLWPHSVDANWIVWPQEWPLLSLFSSTDVTLLVKQYCETTLEAAQAPSVPVANHIIAICSMLNHLRRQPVSDLVMGSKLINARNSTTLRGPFPCLQALAELLMGGGILPTSADSLCIVPILLLIGEHCYRPGSTLADPGWQP